MTCNTGAFVDLSIFTHTLVSLNVITNTVTSTHAINVHVILVGSQLMRLALSCWCGRLLGCKCTNKTTRNCWESSKPQSIKRSHPIELINIPLNVCSEVLHYSFALLALEWAHVKTCCVFVTRQSSFT